MRSQNSASQRHYTCYVEGINVQVIRKAVKNLNLGIYPPHGEVRISVPHHVSDEHVREVVLARLDWIREKQQYYQQFVPGPKLTFVSGEQHPVFGHQHQLDVIQRQGKHVVERQYPCQLKMYVRPGTSLEKKAKLLDEWYRQELKQLLPALIARWEPVIGRKVTEFGIKKMKTRWGTCNIREQRIWLNLELAKHPLACVEYVLVHEMVHLLERNHNRRFHRLMDDFLPDWRHSKAKLNQA